MRQTEASLRGDGYWDERLSSVSLDTDEPATKRTIECSSSFRIP